MWQGAYIFKVSAASGFELAGTITQIPQGGSVEGSYDHHMGRIVMIGDYVYEISNRIVAVNSLADPSAVGEIQFAA